MSGPLDTPVLFMVFNRLEESLQVLERIRGARPRRLFISGDGPREGRSEEAELCARVRREILARIDWSCDVETKFSEQNLGCKQAISSAIGWFFNEVEEGIILEDDCVPDPSFFPYAQALLEKYRDEPRISHIGGFNCQRGTVRGPASYYFSRYFHVWGWATWRRAWKKYSVSMDDYEEFKEVGGMRNAFFNPRIATYWQGSLDAVHAGLLDTWDYQWSYCNFKRDSLSIVPNVNLVHNIGFNGLATHTTQESGSVGENHSQALDVDNLIHPRFLLADMDADRFTYTDHCGISLDDPFPSGRQILLLGIKRIASRVLRGLKRLVRV